MFFLGELSQAIHLPPSEFTSDFNRTVLQKLYKMVESTCTTNNGFIIAVTQIIEIGGGRIAHTGHAIFNVKFTALLLNPIKDEILDAFVINVNELGIFCEAGPLSIFVSNYHIPVSKQGHKTIRRDMHVRLRIIGFNISSKKMYAIGSINEEFLGIIN